MNARRAEAHHRRDLAAPRPPRRNHQPNRMCKLLPKHRIRFRQKLNRSSATRALKPASYWSGGGHEQHRSTPLTCPPGRRGWPCWSTPRSQSAPSGSTKRLAWSLALPPTIQPIAEAVGVIDILVSGKAAERRLPGPRRRVWRMLLPVLKSASTCPAISVKPRASSISRKATNPASDVTRDPWNFNLRRRSKASRRSHVSSSPAAS